VDADESIAEDGEVDAAAVAAAEQELPIFGADGGNHEDCGFAFGGRSRRVATGESRRRPATTMSNV